MKYHSNWPFNFISNIHIIKYLRGIDLTRNIRILSGIVFLVVFTVAFFKKCFDYTIKGKQENQDKSLMHKKISQYLQDIYSPRLPRLRVLHREVKIYIAGSVQD